MNILDRYIYRSFFTNLFLWFVSFVGIFVVFDLLSNIESYFSIEGGRSIISVLTEYFFYRTFLFVDIILPLLILISALTVASSMLRRNEIIALMAMGVPHRRVLIPLLIATILLSGIAFGIREFYLPVHIIRLIQSPSELSREQSQLPVSRTTDNWSKITFDGQTIDPIEKKIEEPKFMLPVLLAPHGNELTADTAIWHDADEHLPDGYLLRGIQKPQAILTSPSLDISGREKNSTPADTAESGNPPPDKMFKPVLYSPADTPSLKPDECFIATGITPEFLCVGDMWKLYASTADLIRAVKNPSIPLHSNDLQVRVHSRILRPLADLLPILVGLPFLFLKNDRSVFQGMATGMLFAGLYMGISYCALYFGKELNTPVLGAWFPLLVFTPIVANVFADLWKS